MTLDADIVLWALRGLKDSQGRGVPADDVAHFMSKDATLSEYYSSEDIAIVLESLIEEGTLVYASGSDLGEFDEKYSSDAGMRYRFAAGTEWLLDTGGILSTQVAWEDVLGPGANERHRILLEGWSEVPTVEVETRTSTAAQESHTDLHLSVRLDEMELERDALHAERDSWQQRAESAEQRLKRLCSERDELHAQIHELEHLLEQERVRSSERSQAARRAGAALARARNELERLEPAAAKDHPQSQTARHRKRPRGNWLQ